MPRRSVFAWVLCAVFLSAPLAAQQNATIQGTVVDDQKGLMPGVTVTAVEITTGRQTVEVTSVEGRYQFQNLPPGAYTLRIELPGFATAELTGIELLVGANATVPPVTMRLASLEETVTVSSQTPLVDLSSARVATNIDRRQMAELPLQGRNWMELSLMVKGITANNIGNTPGVSDDQFQLNLDGQQISQRISGSGFGQPKMSREAIAEFQIVTNMYDITQGRSTGVQVQAVSRSGTNDLRGSAFGFFRSDKLNAPDPVKNVVLPYSDQQAGFTLGGPILRDRIHFFGSYEYERNPSTAILTPTALPNQNWSLPSNTIQKNYLARGDYQHSSKNNFSVRLQRWQLDSPFQIAQRHHPSDDGRAPAVLLDQPVRHMDPRAEQQHDHAGARRHRALLVVRRPDSVEQHAAVRLAVRRAGIPVPQPVARRPAELPELLVDGAVPDPARDELAQRRPRHQVRRRSS